ncbi:MAG: class F sortase [Dehalococcoidia bacterium]|nr:class F sortase [Dehalococcoidia bacterium]
MSLDPRFPDRPRFDASPPRAGLPAPGGRAPSPPPRPDAATPVEAPALSTRRAPEPGRGGRAQRSWRWLAIGAGALVLLLVAIVFGRGGGPLHDGSAAARDADADARAAVDPVVRSIERLHAEHGEPPDATLGRIRIPSIGVDAPLGPRVVGPDGVMANPTGPGDVAWYDLSAWPGLGGRPGEPGNAVFAGHVDEVDFLAYAGVQYAGPGVFWRLDQLRAGAAIEIEIDGAKYRYVVRSNTALHADDAAWSAVLRSVAPAERITLITCGGEFNRAQRTYSSRTVVVAERA